MWAEQITGLGGVYRVIAPDLRGHGDSPTPEGIYAMDTMADDVIELLDTLSIDEPVVVGGLSMGGYVALSLIARYPQRVRALMLMDTRAEADSPEAAAKREELSQAVLAAGDSGPVVEVMIPRLFTKRFLQLRPERVAPLLTVMEQNPPRGIAGALRGMAKRPDRRSDLKRIAVPTLVLVGEEDVITPPDEVRTMAQEIPGARLEVIPEAGHLAPYEQYSVANSVMLEFLERLQA
jgi:pimeloyl-ACP methyl ester carboxylesterase